MSLTLSWRRRELPLAPEGLWAQPEHGAQLIDALLRRGDSALAGLRGVAHQGDGLVLVGPAELLPWSPGVRYLGAEPSQPRVLMPTTSAPTLPLDLVARALLRRCGEPALVAVLDEPAVALPLRGLLPLERDMLHRWRRDAR